MTSGACVVNPQAVKCQLIIKYCEATVSHQDSTTKGVNEKRKLNLKTSGSNKDSDQEKAICAE
jgi:hypothetical protein